MQNYLLLNISRNERIDFQADQDDQSNLHDNRQNERDPLKIL